MILPISPEDCTVSKPVASLEAKFNTPIEDVFAEMDTLNKVLILF